ncbi:MAG TPA: sigma-70 family RNA polymerase sigma factor [Steroidobacteraceae bacterium]
MDQATSALADFDDETPLIARMLEGEQQAFGSFFDAHFPRLYRFAKSRLEGDEELAREVVVASLCKAMRKLSSFRGDAAIFTWLCRICLREIVDRVRVRRRYREHIVLIDDEPELAEIVDVFEDEANADPLFACSRAELARRVHEVLDHLPGRYANALEWKYIEGRSVEEIADRLGIGHTATQSMLARARVAFRVGIQRACGAAEADPQAFLEA